MEAAVDWWATLCARGMGRQQLLPWLFQVGRLLVPGGDQRSGGVPGGHRRVDGRLMALAPEGSDLYRTSCIVGHLEVDDGVTALGERLWHCRRLGCGAGRFAQRSVCAAPGDDVTAHGSP